MVVIKMEEEIRIEIEKLKQMIENKQGKEEIEQQRKKLDSKLKEYLNKIG